MCIYILHIHIIYILTYTHREKRIQYQNDVTFKFLFKSTLFGVIFWSCISQKVSQNTVSTLNKITKIKQQSSSDYKLLNALC